MISDARAFAVHWRDACNSHDPDRILALYAEDVIFKSPRVRTVSDEPSGTLSGKAAVRSYWRKILEKRPDPRFEIGHVFAGADSIALEYRVGDVHGIEFMILNAEGLVSFAAGNDAI